MSDPIHSRLMPSPRYRHKKRGTTYRVLHRGAELQAAQDVIEGFDMVVYQCEQTGKVWVRWEDEFDDGRFEQIDGPVSSQSMPSPKERGK